ncbi:transcriptional repressor LexA [Megasphaera vaginalis (ex Bordigoni et al. 2020)]|uniref:transcriptional repressor LexA n=1 Tax=Megasphaera vaginalis (ex Bordigoni et al. 2020) TaxID=2045301 RepID=UPI000C7A6342|nr:transcriptional repressor LexA [Megasphaera vaginalis (ex Bordigoni et al. 2020)]
MLNNEKLLNHRQRQILEYIRSCVHQNGYPPSIREICSSVGLSSTATVYSHLKSLEENGLIRRGSSKNRTIELLDEGSWRSKKVVPVPIVGQVRAGVPVLAEEVIEDVYPFPAEFIGDDDCFMLTVRGDSMRDAGILEGDWLIVRKQDLARNGEIVVAMLEDEATVKRYYLEKDCVRLQPENDAYEPIYTRNCKILGKVIGVFRLY